MRARSYLQFVRAQPCAVCGTTRRIEAAHTGPRGLGQKTSDFSSIPLCVRHHRTGVDSLHASGPLRFSEIHGLDVPALVAELNTQGLEGLKLHAFSRREPSPGFTRFHCACGFQTAWYRSGADARAALHHHIEAFGNLDKRDSGQELILSGSAAK